MQNYWLYYGNQPIYAVRLPPGSSDQDVRQKAYNQHQSVPLCFPDTPAEFSSKLIHAEVRV